MAITLAEILQVSFDLVRRAEQAEAQIQLLQAEIETLQVEIHKLRTDLQDAVQAKELYREMQELSTRH